MIRPLKLMSRDRYLGPWRSFSRPSAKINSVLNCRRDIRGDDGDGDGDGYGRPPTDIERWRRQNILDEESRGRDDFDCWKERSLGWWKKLRSFRSRSVARSIDSLSLSLTLLQMHVLLTSCLLGRWACAMPSCKPYSCSCTVYHRAHENTRDSDKTCDSSTYK